MLECHQVLPSSGPPRLEVRTSVDRDKISILSSFVSEGEDASLLVSQSVSLLDFMEHMIRQQWKTETSHAHFNSDTKEVIKSFYFYYPTVLEQAPAPAPAPPVIAPVSSPTPSKTPSKRRSIAQQLSSLVGGKSSASTAAAPATSISEDSSHPDVPPSSSADSTEGIRADPPVTAGDELPSDSHQTSSGVSDTESLKKDEQSSGEGDLSASVQPSESQSTTAASEDTTTPSNPVLSPTKSPSRRRSLAQQISSLVGGSRASSAETTLPPPPPTAAAIDTPVSDSTDSVTSSAEEPALQSAPLAVPAPVPVPAPRQVLENPILRRFRSKAQLDAEDIDNEEENSDTEVAEGEGEGEGVDEVVTPGTSDELDSVLNINGAPDLISPAEIAVDHNSPAAEVSSSVADLNTSASASPAPAPASGSARPSSEGKGVLRFVSKLGRRLSFKSSAPAASPDVDSSSSPVDLTESSQEGHGEEDGTGEVTSQDQSTAAGGSIVSSGGTGRRKPAVKKFSAEEST